MTRALHRQVSQAQYTAWGSDSDSGVVKAIEGMQRTMETHLTKFLLEFKATKDKVEEDMESQEEVIEEVKDSITGAWTEIESLKSENGELKMSDV